MSGYSGVTHLAAGRGNGPSVPCGARPSARSGGEREMDGRRIPLVGDGMDSNTRPSRSVFAMARGRMIADAAPGFVAGHGNGPAVPSGARSSARSGGEREMDGRGIPLFGDGMDLNTRPSRSVFAMARGRVIADAAPGGVRRDSRVGCTRPGHAAEAAA